MKMLALPVLAAALMAFAAPAAMAQCSWSKQYQEQTTEKPTDEQAQTS